MTGDLAELPQALWWGGRFGAGEPAAEVDVLGEAGPVVAEVVGDLPGGEPASSSRRSRSTTNAGSAIVRRPGVIGELLNGEALARDPDERGLDAQRAGVEVDGRPAQRAGLAEDPASTLRITFAAAGPWFLRSAVSAGRWPARQVIDHRGFGVPGEPAHGSSWAAGPAGMC